MANSKKFVSLFVISAVALVVCCIVGCTDDEQAKMIDRQKKMDNQDQQTQPAPPPVSTPTSSDTNVSQPVDTPAQPETKTVTTYHFTSSTERNPVDCNREGEIHECGLKYNDCGKDGNETYGCQVGVHEWYTVVEETVTN
jgi:hypothetical protein